MMAPVLSYGLPFEAWTLLPDAQPLTSDLIQYDLNHIGFLPRNPGLYPDINAHIVTYCPVITKHIQTADETIMPADVQEIVALLTRYMRDIANTGDQTTNYPESDATAAPNSYFDA